MFRSLPPKLLETAREFAEGKREPVTPRDAATVLLLREGEQGMEVFMMVRRRSMAFAAGMAVFPGGGVDERDRVASSTGIAAPAQDDSRGTDPISSGEASAIPVEVPVLGSRMGCTDEEAAAIVRAAVRELQEETGVVVSPHDLGLWDAWTTPEFEPRRYRTWFFTARLPEGQTAEELSTESSLVAWVRPAEALAKKESGEWMLMPPTHVSCLRLATYDSVDAVMAETREAAVEMFTPTLEGEGLTSPAWAAPLLERP
jgi:8-oxo-dGTP pyrophosphatase MutT (NUDIX family)